MSGRSSPVNGVYEAANTEPAMRLTVRKDLFPDVRLPKLTPVVPDAIMTQEDVDDVSFVKLETDFEQSIDDIANQKQQIFNGAMSSTTKTRHRKHKQHSRRHSERTNRNGCLSPEIKRRRNLPRNSSLRISPPPNIKVHSQVKGGKNLNLVSSSECQDDDEQWDEEEEMEDEESSEDEVLKCSVKLPLINVPRQSGKPYSHELSQLSTKKSKKNSSKERRTHAVIPCSGKPRSMLGISSSRSKKKSKKSESAPTYRSQIVDLDTNNIKIKIKRTGLETITPTPTSIADLGQRKSKKKRAASPVVSESSGEEYDPRGDTTATMSVAAPKPRHARPKTPKTRKCNTSKTKDKSEKTERNRVSEATSKDSGPQSPWAHTIPEEILEKIFANVVSSQGTLPTVIRLGRVCKKWYSVSCRPQLWKNVDLAQYTTEKCKTDYKLVWLLENRLSQCQSLNIAQWKVCNITWVLACVADYCPELLELSVAGWSRITAEQLFELVQGLPKLQRLDLSLTSETGSSSCLSAASMARVADNFGSRLTHLNLANNKFTALSQILSSVAARCLNLEVLDISGAQATSHPASVPLEALQKGCPKLRVFRAANSQLVLASATTSQQMESDGWSQLEELSIAGSASTERVGVGEYRLGDEALARLVRGATRLRLLDLRGLQRLSDSGLVRVPAWDLQHLFLGGCNVTRQSNACLELICEKWSHSLIELDLSWASAKQVLDAAVSALADSPDSKLRILNLCGSSVSWDAVKKVLLRCRLVESINLSSCRALPRGMKRLFSGKELQDLKDSLDPEKAKTKDIDAEKEVQKKDAKKADADSESDTESKGSPKLGTSQCSDDKEESKSQDQSSSPIFQEPKSVSDSNSRQTTNNETTKSSPDSKTSELLTSKEAAECGTSAMTKHSSGDSTPKLLSPMAQSRPDSSSTPRSEPLKADLGSPYFSPASKPDSQVHNSPEVQTESVKSNNSWNLGQFKSTPNKSEASPLNRLESHSKIKHGKMIEQCSPTTSLENKPSPETIGLKQDIKNPNNWNYGSPMPRQDQFSSQRSPYSAQPSPAQPSPYSTQPSPYSTQPSPYSSQPSPYSAQPSPDTSQIVKTDLQKTGTWNTGNYSPMPKHHAPFSPHPSTHTSPDPGLNVKGDIRNTPNKTPGQYSPMSRQDRLHHSPYSPRPSVDNVAYINKKSPGVGSYSPLKRPDCHLPSPDTVQTCRPVVSGRTQDIYSRPVTKVPELIHNNVAPPEVNNSWGMDRFNLSTPTSSIESLVWGTQSFNAEPPMQPRVDNIPAMLNTPPAQSWNNMPVFDSGGLKPNEDISDAWTLGQFRVEPPHQVHNTYVDQNVNFDSLSAHLGQAHGLPNYLEDNYTETSRVD
ncbi:F-box and leucine-rich repeat protein 6 [Aphomia sociella]